MKKYFCTECNTELQIKSIENMSFPQLVCMNCSRIELGYEEHERELVVDLQKNFTGELWKVRNVLIIFRSHLKKRGN